MSYGLQVLNSSGYIQIDDTLSQYSVLQSGTVQGSNRGVTKVGFTAQAYPPLVVIRPHGYGSGYAFCGPVWNDAFHFVAPSLNYYDYKVLVPVKTVGASNASHGLRLYNSSGQVLFDSNQTNILRVHSIQTLQTTQYSTYEFSVPNSSGLPLWFSLNGLTWAYNFIAGGDSSGEAWWWHLYQKDASTYVIYEDIVDLAYDNDHNSATMTILAGTFP